MDGASVGAIISGGNIAICTMTPAIGLECPPEATNARSRFVMPASENTGGGTLGTPGVQIGTGSCGEVSVVEFGSNNTASWTISGIAPSICAEQPDETVVAAAHRSPVQR